MVTKTAHCGRFSFILYKLSIISKTTRYAAIFGFIKEIKNNGRRHARNDPRQLVKSLRVLPITEHYKTPHKAIFSDLRRFYCVMV